MIPTPEQPKLNRGLLAKIGVIVGIAGLLLVAGLIARNVMVARQTHKQNEQEIAQATRTIEDEVEQCVNAEDPEGCRRAAVNNQAVRVSSAELCSLLTGADLENCVRLIAQESLDRSDCKALEAEPKRRCEDDVTVAVAKANTDLRLCDNMHDDVRAETCRQLVTGLVVAEGTCRKHAVEASLCEDADILARAVADADIELCDEFDGAVRMGCREEVSEVLEADTDGDGLSLREERQYRTDPEVRDTDGDGFSDGVEVRGGYNPLGEGTL